MLRSEGKRRAVGGAAPTFFEASPQYPLPAGMVELHQVVCRFHHLLDLGQLPEISELVESTIRPQADGSDHFNTVMVCPIHPPTPILHTTQDEAGCPWSWECTFHHQTLWPANGMPLCTLSI